VSAIPKWRDFCKQDKFWGAKDKVNLKVNLLRFLQDDNRIQQAMNFNPKATGDTFNVRDEKQDGNLLK
jgi:hypothetical protein